MIHDRSKSRWALTLAVISLVAAACGSTVPVTQQQAAEEAAATGGGDGLGGLPPGTTVNEEGQAVNAEGEPLGGGGVPGRATGGSAPAPQTGGTSRTASGANGIGVTSKTLSIGVVIVKGGDEAAASLGVPGASQADKRKVWRALADEANRSGGILGRKIVPVFHEIEASSSKTVEQQGQEACADWTQDRPVFGTPGYPSFGESFLACMGKAGAVIAGGSVFNISDQRVFQRHPYYLLPNSMDLNTQGKLMVDSLHGQRYFGRGAKIGLVTFDDPNFRYAVQQSIVPGLSRKGLKLGTEPAYLTRPRTLDQYSAAAADARNAVLRFSARGITHVMILDFGAIATILFTQSAENQGYRPRYGLNSQSGNTIAAANMSPATARAQFKGARSVGWAPAADVRPDEEPKNNTRDRCLAIMAKHNVTFSSRNARGQAIQECDSLWFMMAALRASGSRVINQNMFLQGVARLGTGYRPGMTFITSVSSSRHDGAAGARNLSYDQGCNCFHYTTGVYAVPN